MKPKEEQKTTLKAMVRKAGDAHHLRELQQIEQFLHTDFHIDQLYEDVIAFLERRFPDKKSFEITIEDLKEIDKYVKTQLWGKMEVAEQWIVRAFLVGKIIDTREAQTFLSKAPIDVKGMPTKVKDAIRQYDLNPREAQSLKYSVAHTAQHLASATNTTINRVQSITFNNLIKREGTRQLRQQLQDEFFDDRQEVNRNWNRVAISEVSYAFNNGYIANMKSGQYVVGLSMIDRCPHCGALIDGKVYAMIETDSTAQQYGNLEQDNPEYQRRSWIWEHCVWTGKDNYGRSGSPKKNTAEGQIEREHHELYMPAIPVHPYCRCRWVRINPLMQYVEGNEVKMRAMDEKAWQTWYDRTIQPLQMKLLEYRLL